jgi:hypothetical protein
MGTPDFRDMAAARSKILLSVCRGLTSRTQLCQPSWPRMRSARMLASRIRAIAHYCVLHTDLQARSCLILKKYRGPVLKSKTDN